MKRCTYRPEIDGLRAIAITPVILFHSGFEPFKGGYLGVDVFFVISGYLITSIIVNDINLNKFKFSEFYLRRARRILPALLFTMLLCIPLAYFTLFPRDYQNFSGSLNTTLIFLSNIFFWKVSGGYFSTRAELQPLLHTWSLAVEEQFYLLYPILIYLLRRSFKLDYRYFLIAIGLISLFYSEYLSYSDPDASFFLFHTRAWELIAGALCLNIKSNKNENINNAISSMGLLSLIAVFFLIPNGNHTHQRLFPVILTSILIIFSTPQTLSYKLLTQNKLVLIGTLSYSAYLIHQPLLAFARNIAIFEISKTATFIILLSIFPLSYLQNHWIENPFRNPDKSNLSNSKFLKIFGSLSLFILAMGLLGELTKGLPQRPIALLKNTNYAEREIDKFRDECIDGSEFSKIISEPRCHLGAKKDKINFMLLGDSFSAAIADGIDRATKDLNLSGLLLGMHACLPVLGIGTEYVPVKLPCENYQNKLIEYINEVSPEIIILHGNWSILNSPEWWARQHSNEQAPFKGAILNTLDKMGDNQQKSLLSVVYQLQKIRLIFHKLLLKFTHLM